MNNTSACVQDEWKADAQLLGKLRESIMQLLERDPLKRQRVTNVRLLWSGTLQAALADSKTKEGKYSELLKLASDT